MLPSPPFLRWRHRRGVGTAGVWCAAHRMHTQMGGHLLGHLFLLVQLRLSSFGMLSVCPQHLSLQRQTPISDPDLWLLGLSRAGSATETEIFWLEQPGNVFSTSETEAMVLIF